MVCQSVVGNIYLNAILLTNVKMDIAIGY